MKQLAMKKSGRRQAAVKAIAVPFLLGLCATAFAAPQFGNCEVSGKRGSVKLETTEPGALSVRPVLPSPGWWNGDSPSTIKDGFEYCMAANMAYRAGLDRLNIVTRSFAQVLTGQSKGFDIALSEITITEQRKKVVDFTIPYFTSDQGILVKTDTKIDQDSIKNMRLGVLQGSTIYHYLMENVKPKEHPKVYTDTAPMYAALAAGQVDAVLYDTPNVLARAKRSNGLFRVAGRYDTGERWGGLVNKDSPNLEAFNTLIQEMIDDGTFDKLAAKYLTPTFGDEPSHVPLFTP
ncbi:ABC transporter substrate-binding protein [Bordetella sp. BOR01]|uniref:ABC transporter substrate-binding protein n=1 Tax=Bordetella sp. BOR01 TaxID=2854779 RepID=UPI001C45AD00|nr:ABC transporter substrate-binding protein [Bordetella sp. BOR01]MBV7482117.1 ABC transporter substrate-binding protein [Bordetella sp. BOR01]